MAAYRRVYDSRHLQADCQELGSVLGSWVWATFAFYQLNHHPPFYDHYTGQPALAGTSS